MVKTITTRVVEYTRDEWDAMLIETIFCGAVVEIEYRISEVDGDPLDHYPGHKDVVAVRIIKEEVNED